MIGGFWWIWILGLSSALGSRSNEELGLLKTLMTEYDINVRPVLHHTHSLVVHFNLSILQIVDLDEKNQVLSANFFLHFHWTDWFLRWEPSGHGGVRDIRISAERLWRPDITLDNDTKVAIIYSDVIVSVSIDRRSIEHLHLAVVHYDGNVSWVTPITYHTSCALDITYYPWDKQVCKLQFSSWGYDITNMDIMNGSDVGETSFFIGSSEWIIERFTVTRDIFFHPHPYPLLEYSLFIKRKPHYIVFNLILPSIFITFCAYFVFLLPPESGEKVTMSVTLLLSITVFLLLIADYLPAQSDHIPVLSQYFLSVIILLVLTTGTTVMVLYIHYHGALKVVLPPWAKKSILQWLATVVFMKDKVDLVLDPKNKGAQSHLQSGEIHSEIEIQQHSLASVGCHHGNKHMSADPEYLEWVMCAMVLDRIFMGIFVTVTIIITVTLMVDHPK